MPELSLADCKLRLQQWNKCACILLLNAQAKYTQIQSVCVRVCVMDLMHI